MACYRDPACHRANRLASIAEKHFVSNSPRFFEEPLVRWELLLIEAGQLATVRPSSNHHFQAPFFPLLDFYSLPDPDVTIFMDGFPKPIDSATRETAEMESSAIVPLALPELAPDETSVENSAARDTRIELGHLTLSDHEDERQLGRVYFLDHRLHDPVDVIVEGRLVARGQLVNCDQRIAIRVTETMREGPLPPVDLEDDVPVENSKPAP